MRGAHTRLLIFLLMLVVLFLVVDYEGRPKNLNIREPLFAGQWYPKNPSELDLLLEELPKNCTQEKGIRAVLVPHAGYSYSAPVAAKAYCRLSDVYDKVVVLASNHDSDAKGFVASIPEFEYYKTPLGLVKVSAESRQLLDESSDFISVPEAHRSHVVELQLPFLQKRLGSFEIIPIVTGAMSDVEISYVAERIGGLLDEETLLVVSTDLSHYHGYQDAVLLDRSCLETITSLQSDCEACGLDAIKIVEAIAERYGWAAEVLGYGTSGDTGGDLDSVVGYGAVAYKGDLISLSDKEYLTLLARSTLEDYVAQGSYQKVLDPPEAVRRNSACFVTLKDENGLRGCIGTTQPLIPLFECVQRNTAAAASRDARFPAVRSEETEGIDIEISVLTEPKRLDSPDGTYLLDGLSGTEGLIIRKGSNEATFLPQVWEQLPEKRDFLSRLCEKAGLESSCWDDGSVEIFSYDAVVLG